MASTREVARKAFIALEGADESAHYRALNGRLDDPLRGLYWRVFLGLIAEGPPGTWQGSLGVTRIAYERKRRKHTVDPHHSPLLGDRTEEHPLSQSDSSVWHQHFEDETFRGNIQKDVLRTFSTIPFFCERQTQDMLLRILFVWAKEHSETSYGQGMNEVLGCILHVLYLGSYTVSGRADNELDEGLDAVLDLTFVEHDAYALFDLVMSTGIAQAYVDESDWNPTLEKASRVQTDILPKFNPRLARFLGELSIMPHCYLLTWFRLLCGREFDVPHCLVAWDAMFAFSSDLSLLTYVCAAMLVVKGDELMTMSHDECLKMLLRYPVVPPAEALCILQLAQNMHDDYVFGELGCRKTTMRSMGSQDEARSSLESTRASVDSGPIARLYGTIASPPKSPARPTRRSARRAARTWKAKGGQASATPGSDYRTAMDDDVWIEWFHEEYQQQYYVRVVQNEAHEMEVSDEAVWERPVHGTIFTHDELVKDSDSDYSDEEETTDGIADVQPQGGIQRWVQYYSDDHACHYYFNADTKEVVWEHPGDGPLCFIVEAEDQETARQAERAQTQGNYYSLAFSVPPGLQRSDRTFVHHVVSLTDGGFAVPFETCVEHITSMLQTTQHPLGRACRDFCRRFEDLFDEDHDAVTNLGARNLSTAADLIRNYASSLSEALCLTFPKVDVIKSQLAEAAEVVLASLLHDPCLRRLYMHKCDASTKQMEAACARLPNIAGGQEPKHPLMRCVDTLCRLCDTANVWEKRKLLLNCYNQLISMQRNRQVHDDAPVVGGVQLLMWVVAASNQSALVYNAAFLSDYGVTDRNKEAHEGLAVLRSAIHTLCVLEPDEFMRISVDILALEASAVNAHGMSRATKRSVDPFG